MMEHSWKKTSREYLNTDSKSCRKWCVSYDFNFTEMWKCCKRCHDSAYNSSTTIFFNFSTFITEPYVTPAISSSQSTRSTYSCRYAFISSVWYFFRVSFDISFRPFARTVFFIRVLLAFLRRATTWLLRKQKNERIIYIDIYKRQRFVKRLAIVKKACYSRRLATYVIKIIPFILLHVSNTSPDTARSERVTGDEKNSNHRIVTTARVLFNV